MPQSKINRLPADFLVYTAWLVAIIATVGSLSLSQIWHYVPCDLCWFQRIFMYPLPFIIGAGIWLKDQRLAVYVLPLTAVGGLIAFYHTLLQWGIVESITKCSIQAPCTVKYINWFGFITIPFMSLIAFITVATIMSWHYRRVKASS